MNKKGFTLIELLAVIAIIGIAALLITTNVEKRIKAAKTLLNDSKIETIESAAYLYSVNYSSEITDLENINVATVTLSTLLSKDLIESTDITVNNQTVPTTNKVVIANIDNSIKTKYDVNQTGKNIIFLKGLNEITIKKNSTYTDMGASVAIVGTGITELTSSNMTSTVNTSVKGTYTVTYTYINSISVVRTVNVV